MNQATFTSTGTYKDRSIQFAECSKADATHRTPGEGPIQPPGGDPEPSPSYCTIDNCSPILIALDPGPPRLTGLDDTVSFDIDADGSPDQITWTSADYDGGGFLVLDRDGDGLIENGRELFGTATEQPESEERNGFLALGELDLPYNGGDADGEITPIDSVFGWLAIWKDRNTTACRNRTS